MEKWPSASVSVLIGEELSLGTLMYITWACLTAAPVTLLTTEPSSSASEFAEAWAQPVRQREIDTIRYPGSNRKECIKPLADFSYHAQSRASPGLLIESY